MNDPVIELEIQKAANRDLLRSIADLTIKHDYQVRRADQAETRIVALNEVVDTRDDELKAANEEFGLLRHILIELGNGRFQRLPKPEPGTKSVPNGTPMSFDNGGETTWPNPNAKGESY